MTARDIARDRAASLRLSAPTTTPARLVAWLGAVQSQDYPLGTWSIAQRLATPNADVERAVADGSILRTHVLRPTWHFVAREDLRWMQALTSPRVLGLMRYADRANGIDGAVIARSTRVIAGAIERRGHLTRREIADVLSRARVATSAWKVGHLLMHAELRAVVCSGAPIGGRQTYALVDERAPRAASMPRDEALAALARRYFKSHGPATARDFQWWSGLTAADVARALDVLGRVLKRRRCGDRTFISIGPPPRATAAGKAHVIQPFDELVVAYSESRDVVDVSGAARAGAPGASAALLTRGVVYDGQLIARWGVPSDSRPPAISVQALRRLSRIERDAIAVAAARFEAFLLEQ